MGNNLWDSLLRARGFSREKNLPECFTNAKYSQRRQHSRIGSRGAIVHSREYAKNTLGLRPVQVL